MRCPTCGRLALLTSTTADPKPQGLPKQFAVDHDIDIRMQTFTGNGQQGPGTGFAWSTRKLPRVSLMALRRLLAALVKRCDQMLEEDYGNGEAD